jgi:hypothetical protein
MPGGFFNQARMTVSSSGTGTFALNAAVSPWNTFANAGVADQTIVPYGAMDTSTGGSEKGWGLYSATGSSLSGPSLTRNVFTSTNGNAAVAFSLSAQVYIDEGAADLAWTAIMAHANFGGL